MIRRTALLLLLCAPLVSALEISGKVYDDRNSNGIMDGADVALSNWIVFLDVNENGVRDAGETFTTTDVAGAYTFTTGLSATMYRVAVEMQSGWDVVNPRLPLRRMGRYDSNTHQYGDCWGQGTLAAIGSYSANSQVQLIDVSNPSAPTLAGVWDETSPHSSEAVSRHGTSGNGSQFEDVVIANGIGYFASNNGQGIHIVNVADPGNVRTLAHIDQGASAAEPLTRVHTIALDGNHLYAADNLLPKVYVFNVSVPAAPVHVRTIAVNAPAAAAKRVHEVTVKGGRLFVAINEGATEETASGINVLETEVWDVSNVAAGATFLGAYNSGYNTHTVTVTDNGRYAISAREPYPWEGAVGDVTIWDIADPSAAVKVATLNATPLGFGNVTAHIPMAVGNTLYVSWYWAGVKVFDISDPTRPALAGGFDTSNLTSDFDGCWGVHPVPGTDLILASDIQNGLFVFKKGQAGGHYTDLAITPTATGFDFALRRPPAVSVAAVPSQFLPLGGGSVVVNLDATTTYEAANTPGLRTFSWSQVSGPAGVVFGNAAAEDTTATLNKPGTYVFKLVATDGVATGEATVTVVVANRAPSITSTSATPNPVKTGIPVAFSAAASDPDGDTLTYTWNFGDGSTAPGASTAHSYATAGDYSVSVTVSDGNGGSASAILAVKVEPASAPAPTPPPAPLPAPTAPPALPLVVSKLSGSVQYANGGRDGCSFSGTIPGVPAGFDPTGMPVSVDVGGAVVEFVLDQKGRGKSGQGSFTLTLKTGKTPFAGGDVPFKAQLKRGTWSAVWLDEGIDPAKESASVPMLVTITLGGNRYAVSVATSYSGKAGKSGKFKQ